jgi:transcriptional regulator with XRE-family HTH domain
MISEFGELLRTLRHRKGLSQKKLSQMVGISQVSIFRMERGDVEKPTTQVIERLANVLDIDIHTLIKATIPSYKAPFELPDNLISKLQLIMPVAVPVVAELHMPGEILEYVYVERAKSGPANYVGIRAKGFCMEPEILDGDTIILDRNALPEAGKTVLVFHNGDEEPRLIKYKAKEDFKNCDIYGVVVCIVRKI